MTKVYKYNRFKAENRCRFCNHFAKFHVNFIGFGYPPMEAWWDKCTKPATNCFCPGFGPEDNLDFFVYKWEQKELNEIRRPS